MKITKSELKNLIHETLREELAKQALTEETKPMKEDQEVDPVQQALDAVGHIELEYEGFDKDWYEDKWDYKNSEHYQDYGTDHIGDFVYEVDATEAFETLIDLIPKQASEKASKLTGKAAALLTKYMELDKAWDEAAGTDSEDKACEAVELFLANNLDEFAEIFQDELYDYYREAAYEWGEENLEPEEYWPDWED